MQPPVPSVHLHIGSSLSQTRPTLNKSNCWQAQILISVDWAAALDGGALCLATCHGMEMVHGVLVFWPKHPLYSACRRDRTSAIVHPFFVGLNPVLWHDIDEGTMDMFLYSQGLTACMGPASDGGPSCPMPIKEHVRCRGSCLYQLVSVFEVWSWQPRGGYIMYTAALKCFMWQGITPAAVHGKEV